MPNMARNANVLGIARELSALTGRELRKPTIEFIDGRSIRRRAGFDRDHRTGTQSALCAGADPRCGDQAEPLSNPAHA